MRHLRLRLRSSVVFSLTTLSFVFLITLHTLVWTTTELELSQQIPEPPKPPVAIPFWSALDQANIYDVKATSQNKLNRHSSYITSDRIDELYQLVRQSRNEQIQVSNKIKSFPINSPWNFEKFLGQKLQTNINDTNTHIDTADSAAKKQSNNKHQFDMTTTEKTMNEHDKKQLRDFIHHTSTKWKKKHQSDKTISLADIMHDALAQDEPG